MKKLLCCLLIFFAGLAHQAAAQQVKVLYAKDSPQATYAARTLEKALQSQGYTLKRAPGAYVISLALDTSLLESEAYAIRPLGKKISITGGDERGLIYGSLRLAESISQGVRLSKVRAESERPDLAFRAIKFNLPWDAYREGYAMELHTQTCRDLRFWQAFLDMMAENRFNALTLWNLHPFTTMIKPRNFPLAVSFSDQELADWQALYRGIFRMAKERGIDTYLVNWNIFVSPAFARAYQVAQDNLPRIHFGNGDTSEVIKRYTRESITQVLEEYPDLTGIGLTHGEAMRGMTPQQRQDWFSETILEGMRLANRKSKLIHRVPLEANTKVGGSTSVDTEALTRKAMEALDFLDGPIWAEIKFNWSHAHSSPRLIKVHGGKLSDTYFRPEPKNYKVAWMARNEDFFCLRWGVPDFIRQHLATNTQSYVGGYFVGSEGYIPAKDYFTRAGEQGSWKYAFERQWLFYKLWGRLLYKAATPNEVFRAEFVRRYGKQGGNLLAAHALAGTTPLRLASAFDFTWDFSLYSEGMMAMDKQSMEYISVDRQISQATADPDYVSVQDYVGTLASGGSFGPEKITPPMLAQMLEQDCRKALQLVKNIRVDADNSLRYEVADVKAWANLGLSFAQKLKGAVALQTYRQQGDEAYKQQAVQHLQQTLHYWDEVIAITRPLYNPMPLAAYSYPHGGNRSLIHNDRRFHWELLRPAVARDIEQARQATVNPVAGAVR